MRGEERKTAHLGPRLCARTISGDSSWSVTSYILDVAELTRDTSYIYPIHLSVSAFVKKVSENSDRKNVLNVHTFGVVLSINSIKTAMALSRGANNSYQLNATDNGFEARCCSVSR